MTTPPGSPITGELPPLTLPGKLDSLAALADYVQQAANLAGLGYKATYRLRLAVDEIATNIIIHGYTEVRQSGTLILSAYWNEAHLAVVLEDRGIYYDPSQAAPPEMLNYPLEERPLGGLGIYLTLWGVDEFYYKRLDNRNRSTFIVKR
jgi:serine/threonine-protein kinase RsbW